MINMVLNEAVRAVTSASRIGARCSTSGPPRPPPADPQGFGAPGAAGRGPLRERGVLLRGVRRARRSTASPSTPGPGETVGIIGPTGSGKSSLVNLVPRFYDATRGAVLLDGRDVTALDERELRPRRGRGAAAAPCSSRAASPTTCAGATRTPPTTTCARRRASPCADEFIDRLPDGLRHAARAGRQVNLSGGQKQRLCIARALLRKPRVLVLDDCTSALDGATEVAILRGLRELAGGITLLLISQRISTVRRADAIVCLENGRMQGFGTHDDLMRTSPTYRAIYDSQTGGAHA